MRAFTPPATRALRLLLASLLLTGAIAVVPTAAAGDCGALDDATCAAKCVDEHGAGGCAWRQWEILHERLIMNVPPEHCHGYVC